MALIFQALLIVSALTVVTARLRIVEAGRNGKVYPVLKNGFEFCPPRKGFSFECLAPGSVNAKGVVIEINGKPKKEYRRPYFAAGNSGNMVYPVRAPYGTVTIKCYGKSFSTQVKGMIMCSRRKDGQKPKSPPAMPKKPEPTPKPMPISAPKGVCIAVKGTSYVGGLKRGWVRTGGTGVTYEPNNGFAGIVGPNYSVLTYKFQVPVAAKYAIVVDMGTKHPTEHNDIWLKCDGGFTLWRQKSVRSAMGFIKVYHNGNGRRKEGITIDFKGYSLSTKQVYRPGKTYTCQVGARSTKTTVYGFVGFPCVGQECQRKTKTWQSGLSRCNV